VPGETPCPVILQPPGGGATWYTFHALLGDGAHARNGGVDTCFDLRLDVREQRQILRGFIFASGSPFPIFPAHRVRREGTEGPAEALVDGGYSNNTPVEAAATLGAEQVLIVNRRPRCLRQLAPVGWRISTVRWWATRCGCRTLFERAQQLDRRSRAGLFVVSLSPACRPRCDGPTSAPHGAACRARPRRTSSSHRPGRELGPAASGSASRSAAGRRC
jgi:predicted acylesterase/phospholipase RssA